MRRPEEMVSDLKVKCSIFPFQSNGQKKKALSSDSEISRDGNMLGDTLWLCTQNNGWIMAKALPADKVLASTPTANVPPLCWIADLR